MDYTSFPIEVRSSIIAIFNHVYHLLNDWTNTLKWFRDQRLIVAVPSFFKNTQYESRCVMIKYMEHNRCWEPWVRDCRGVILFLNDDGNVIPLKSMLQRGAEVLGSLHLKKGIEETQDSSIAKSTLSPSQQELTSKLMNDKPLEGYLSFKVDGSLFCATLYDGPIGNLIKNMILESNDSFAKSVLNHSLKFGKVIVLSSQGTFTMSSHIHCYTITAILGAMGIPDDQIVTIASQLNPIEVFDQMCGPFMYDLSQMFDRAMIKDQTSITFNFETICKNRTSAWGKLHSELTIAYPRSTIKFLGTSVCTSSIMFYPHFLTSFNERFQEPLWWKINHASQIENMMNLLDNIILSKNQEVDFVKNHPPSNPNFVIDQYDDKLDYEGFIIYTPASHGQGVEYNKIKTTTYYNCHKFRKSNIKFLIDISTTAGDIFPLTTKTKNFFMNMSEKMTRVICDLKDEFYKFENSQFFGSLNTKAQQSFMKQDQKTKIRMLMSARQSVPFLFDKFKKTFPDLEKSLSDPAAMQHTCRTLFLHYESQVSPTNPIIIPYEEIGNNDLIDEFISHCFDVSLIH